MNLPHAFRWISASLLFCSVTACQKKPEAKVAAEPTPAAQPQAPAQKLISAEPSSFAAVAQHLDAGGGLYCYLSTESFLKTAAAKLAELEPVILNAAKITKEEKEKAHAFWTVMERVAQSSGLNEVSGFGASSIALEPGYYQTKWMVHHYAGKGNGVIWKMSGAVSDATDLISYLPANTALAGSCNLTLAPVWGAINQDAATNANLRAGLEMMTQQFEQSSGLKLASLLDSIGPNYSLVLTLDDSRKTTLPFGANGNTVTIPEPALAILVQVKDEALLERLNQELAKVPMIVKADQPDLNLRMIPVPLPMPFIRPAVAWKKGLLVISSNDLLIRDLFEVKAGKKPGIATLPEFKKLTTDLATSACQFHVSAPILQKTLMDIQMAAAAQQPGGGDPATQRLIEYFSKCAQQRWMCGIVENTTEGWLGTSRGGGGPAQIVAAGLVAPAAIVAAIAVPSFLKARQNAETIKSAAPAPQ